MHARTGRQFAVSSSQWLQTANCKLLFANCGLRPDNLRIKETVTNRAERRIAPVTADGGRTDERLGRLVRVLTDHAMVVVSGTKLADEIGASRSEVWRLVEQLRSLGVEITGLPATGYQLKAMPDLLLPDIVDPLVQRTMFAGRLHHYFRTGSTNAVAMQAAQAGEDEGSVFFAEEQTAGRGRGGHTWHSARSDGIYVSVILRPQIAPADALLLSLLAGIATAAAVEEVTGLRPDLRWPNDLLLPQPASSPLPHGEIELTGAPVDYEKPETANSQLATHNSQLGTQRKFCGILTELNAEVTRVRYAVVGIGMNVNQSRFPAEMEPIATSLHRESGRTCSRVELAAALLQSLDRLYQRLSHPTLAPKGAARTWGTVEDARRQLFREFEQRSSYARGRRVHVDEGDGYTGVTAGLDERGFLLVQADDGTTRTVISGGVRAI